MKEQNKTGILYIVATPIGNLQDITLRAIDTLKTVNWIAAEDTRHSAALLQHFDVTTPMLALHEHNERERTEKLLQHLQQGESIALISDAGTPLINDPGYFLVHSARAVGIRIVPIPGACAAIAALSVAGLPTDRFLYVGFLAAKKSARSAQLNALCDETATLVFYEAPHRIKELLAALKDVFGPDRPAVLARELTKLFETIHAASLADLLVWVAADANQQRGEIVVLVGGNAKEQQSTTDVNLSMQHILQVLLQDLPLKQAVELTAKLTGEKKNAIYALALELKKDVSL